MPAIALIAADGPFEQALAEAQARVRAGIVDDYLKAVRTGDHIGQLAAKEMAAQIDASTLDGPRLLDELAGLNQPAAA
ncbi:hypothetical protein AB0C77_06695 [Streptomyces sp. NPDC048629]|uniref:hypothetical protein n=1 Tax=Streptomyces sp. NPDC048629 TaxID=3154824 RepID=UPI00342CC316